MQKKVLYIVFIVVALIIITFIAFPSAELEAEGEPSKDEVALGFVDKEDSVKVKTIASAWQWENSPASPVNRQNADSLNVDQQDQLNARVYPFTQESVFKALHAVKLDDNGDIILDDNALIALNQALDHSEFKLDGESLEELQNLIRQSLPGNAGEETAQIVADYYQYLGAKNEFNSLYETSNSTDQSIESYETQYNELIALREVYLGAEVANKLFATSNANSRYMFESMKLEANASLSEQEKKQEHAKIIEQHEEATINVNNWNARYQAFLEDKHYIINSSISENEKYDQLNELMREHFSYEELEYVSHLQLDSL